LFIFYALSVYTGVGGTAGKEMKIAMLLNNNGQSITLSKDFCGLAGFKEVNKAAAAVRSVQGRKEVTFAMTFPGGTHDIWLRNWMAAAGSIKNQLASLPSLHHNGGKHEGG
jgi:nitrate/nitrite transport system substrate-binding protein